MPDDGKRSITSETSRAARSVDTQFESLMSANERAFRSWANGISAFAEEIAQFTKARLSESAESWQVLATCKTPADALECHQRYARKAADQYFEQANKLTQLAMNMANDGFSSLRNTASLTSRQA